VVDAPVAGRVCQTAVRLVPRVTETLVAYDEANHTLTYEASGMPAFVTTARTPGPSLRSTNAAPGSACRPGSTPGGPLGLLGRWMILAQIGRTSRHLADDLRHYVETGQPSPRKQRQLRRAR
jgi:hypothetical protein